MKAELNFLHVCEYSSFSEGGKLNILGIFERLSSATLPFIYPSMCIVSNITIKKNGKYQQKIRIVSGKNEPIIDDLLLPVEVKIPSGKKKAIIGSVGQLNGLRFEKYGKYQVQLWLDGDLIGERELEVAGV